MNTINLPLKIESALRKNFSAVHTKQVTERTTSVDHTLSTAELRYLVKVCTDDRSNRGVRDSAIFCLLLAGLRRVEMLALDVGDIILSAGIINARHSNKIYYLSSDLIGSIEYWITVRYAAIEEKAGLFLAINQSDRILPCRLSSQEAQSIFSKRGIEAGISAKFTCNSTRCAVFSRLPEAMLSCQTCPVT